jgi:hypothetical protein
LSEIEGFDFSFSGGSVIARNSSVVTKETPLSGGDFEVGRKIAPLKGTWFEDSWGYLAAYHFDSRETDSMTGYRARLRTRPFDWLQIGLEHQRDNIRGTQNFAELRFRYAFGPEPAAPYEPQGIYARLDEQVVRDIDIVTQETELDAPGAGASVALVNPGTGSAQDVVHVDNSAAAGGDGSFETPFDTLAAAEAAAGANEIIYVHAGDGTTTNMSSGITIDDVGQKLIGSGSNVTFGDLGLDALGLNIPSEATVFAATSAPVITNTGGDGVRLLADDTEVRGITVDGASSDNTISSSGNHGYYLLPQNSASVNVTIERNDIQGSSNDGVYVDARNTSTVVVDVLGSTFSNNGEQGFNAYAQNDSNITANVSSSTFDDNGNIAVYLRGTSNGVGNFDVRDNSITNNGLSSPLLIQVLKQTLELYRSRPHDIVIEILEDEFPIQKHAKIMKNIESLHQDLGLRLAIDDYGTGASDNVRVADLSRFLYAVKIDKSLINETALAQISTSHFLKGKFLIFEGVETAENIDLVEKYFKNNAMQGHFFDKPLSTTDAVVNPHFLIQSQVRNVRSCSGVKGDV